MQVKEIMTRSAEVVDHEADLVEVAQKMRTFEVGALPVCEGGQLVGMITDRDLTVRAIAEGKDVSDTQVSEIMSPEVFSCFEDDDIGDAAQTMQEKSIHRLLVLNNDEQPVGIVSLADFVVKSNDEHLAWQILDKISEPACPHR